MIEPLLLTTTRITTMLQGRALTSATGFFYEHGPRLFLVTSRHVLVDEPSNHHPDSIEIELHTDAGNLTQSIGFSIPLYRNGLGLWRQARDSTGSVDIAAIELERQALPATLCYHAFSSRDLLDDAAAVDIGSSLLVVGFPLGFHDALHHLPVVRHAINASSFALRFQGNGYFLTDSRTHRGTSGAAVVMRTPSESNPAGFPWKLLGVHSSRLDVDTRELSVDEALGLNCVWFADVIPALVSQGRATENPDIMER
ncbi:MAG: trypsin-like peptidase domain-containing protein [Pseudomonadales bacterium]|nr:trypsin-like peptidase domain-containing protein [Pseudomonadales bacterium]